MCIRDRFLIAAGGFLLHLFANSEAAEAPDDDVFSDPGDQLVKQIAYGAIGILNVRLLEKTIFLVEFGDTPFNDSLYHLLRFPFTEGLIAQYSCLLYTSSIGLVNIDTEMSFPSGVVVEPDQLHTVLFNNGLHQPDQLCFQFFPGHLSTPFKRSSINRKEWENPPFTRKSASPLKEYHK